MQLQLIEVLYPLIDDGSIKLAVMSSSRLIALLTEFTMTNSLDALGLKRTE